jgi:hypothetical protein
MLMVNVAAVAVSLETWMERRIAVVEAGTVYCVAAAAVRSAGP